MPTDCILKKYPGFHVVTRALLYSWYMNATQKMLRTRCVLSLRVAFQCCLTRRSRNIQSTRYTELQTYILSLSDEESSPRPHALATARLHSSQWAAEHKRTLTLTAEEQVSISQLTPQVSRSRRKFSAAASLDTPGRCYPIAYSKRKFKHLLSLSRPSQLLSSPESKLLTSVTTCMARDST